MERGGQSLARELLLHPRYHIRWCSVAWKILLNLRMGECWAKGGSSLKREALREVSLFPQTMIRASLGRGHSTSTIKHCLSPNYLGRAKHPFQPLFQPRPPPLKIKHHHHQTNFLTEWWTMLPGRIWNECGPSTMFIILQETTPRSTGGPQTTNMLMGDPTSARPRQTFKDSKRSFLKTTHNVPPIPPGSETGLLVPSSHLCHTPAASWCPAKPRVDGKEPQGITGSNSRLNFPIDRTDKQRHLPSTARQLSTWRKHFMSAAERRHNTRRFLFPRHLISHCWQST